MEFRQISEEELSLVVGASASYEGCVVPPSTKLDSAPHLYKPERRLLTGIKIQKDVLELQRTPKLVRIIFVANGVAVETKKVMMDYSSRICDNFATFKNVFTKMVPLDDYGIQFNAQDGAPFRNCNTSLKALGFDTVKDVMSLVSVKDVCKLDWRRFGTPQKKGYLVMGHGDDVEQIEKFTRRYAVLVEHFLVVFKKEGEAPTSVIPLDFHCLKKKKDDKGNLSLMIWRLHPKKEMNPHHSSVSHPQASGAKAIMKNTVLGVMVNVQHKVNEIRGVSRNVWIINSDEPNANEVVEQWFKELSDKCVNTGALKLFGIPLDETMGRTRGLCPTVVSKVIGYLDQRLETEGLFRLQGSVSLIDQYRDKFEMGTDVDLSECLDPHVPATILKQFLRELPEPLLLFSNYDTLVDIAGRRIPTDEKRDLIAARLRDTLPPLNTTVLLFLIAFLNRVFRMSDLNKMGLANLGTVFGPNLLRTKEEDPMRFLKDTPCISEVLQILVQHEQWFQHALSGISTIATIQSKPKVFDPPQGDSRSRLISESHSGSNLSSSAPVFDRAPPPVPTKKSRPKASVFGMPALSMSQSAVATQSDHSTGVIHSNSTDFGRSIDDSRMTDAPPLLKKELRRSTSSSDITEPHFPNQTPTLPPRNGYTAIFNPVTPKVAPGAVKGHRPTVSSGTNSPVQSPFSPLGKSSSSPSNKDPYTKQLEEKIDSMTSQISALQEQIRQLKTRLAKYESV